MPCGRYAAWGATALNTTVHAAQYFSSLFGLPYAAINSKSDAVAVAAIEMDAMENQGLVTYAPQAARRRHRVRHERAARATGARPSPRCAAPVQMLLLDPDPASLPPAPIAAMGRLGQAMLIAAVGSHEVAHQWVGMAVTMRDWEQAHPLNEPPCSRSMLGVPPRCARPAPRGG